MLPSGGQTLLGQMSSMTLLFPHWGKPSPSSFPSDFLCPLAKLLTVRGDTVFSAACWSLWCSSHATILAVKPTAQNHFKHAEGICGFTWQEENLPCRNLLNCVCSLGKTLVRRSDKPWRAHVIKIFEIWHTLLTACQLQLLYRFSVMFKKWIQEAPTPPLLKCPSARSK